MVATETLARSHLSQEFQLVFRRLTEGLIPDPSLASFTPSSNQNPSDATPATVTAATAQPTPQGNAATLSDSERIRTASLATLALDPSLAELVPYLIRWLAENISTAVLPGKQGRSVVEIGYLVDALIALVGNSTLFIEPYVSFYPLAFTVSLHPHEVAHVSKRFPAPPTPPSYTLRPPIHPPRSRLSLRQLFFHCSSNNHSLV